MIADQMAQAPAAPDDTSDGINVPPELQEAYERVVLAGMKIMFSEKGNKLVMDQLDEEGPIADKLGKGVAGLLLQLYKMSNQSLPLEVIIPAGIKLIGEAADFAMRASDQEISKADIAKAMEILIMVLLQKFGVDPEQFDAMLNQFDDTAVDQQMPDQQMAAPEQMPAAAPAPAAPPAQGAMV